MRESGRITGKERLYHLTAKALYAAGDLVDVRHRRPIPPHRLAQKLMLLDLTLQEPQHATQSVNGEGNARSY